MVINPPLLFVSGLFFLAMSSMLYLTAFCGVTLLLRLGHRQVSAARAKTALFASLTLPPVLAAVATWSGATLRHSHAKPLLEHHSAACYHLFSALFSSEGTGKDRVAGTLVNGAAWLLMAVGLFYALRLLRATVCLARAVTPCLLPPSPRLSTALARAASCPKPFYECAFPAACSGVLGVLHPRCLLSQDMVASVSEDELHAIVAHEATHLRLHDVQAMFLVSMVDSVFFFLRPVHLMARRWREQAELACDAAAVQATGDPTAMASAIMRVRRMDNSLWVTQPLPLAFAEEAPGLTTRRVENLLAQTRQPSCPEARDTFLRSFGGWLLTLALATVGASLLATPQAVCYAHCSLEAVARLLP